MERHTKRFGRRLDHEERLRKRVARQGHQASKDAQNLRGLRAKMHQQKRHKEKIQMKKQIREHEERNVKAAPEESEPGEAVPAYLLDRNNPAAAKALSSAIKNKRAEKAARFSVPLPKVRGISEEEMFKVVTTGKKMKKKGWKRVVTQPVCSPPLSWPFVPLLTFGNLNRPSSAPSSRDATPSTSASSGPWVYATRRRTLRIPSSR